MAQSKFTESRESLKAISRDNAGTDIMVPITSSLYVKGTVSPRRCALGGAGRCGKRRGKVLLMRWAEAQLADSDSVLVDVGTGYFVEKKVGVAPGSTRTLASLSAARACWLGCWIADTAALDNLF